MNRPGKFYGLLVRLYPGRFRAEFGAEMEAVFGYALEDARRAGMGAVARLVLHELIDLPASLAREHGRALIESRDPLSQAAPAAAGAAGGLASPRPPKVSGRAESLLAALPFVLLGLAMAVPLLVREAFRFSAGSSLEQVFTIILVAVLGVGLLVSYFMYWLHDRPRWTATWTVMWLVAAWGAFYSGITALGLKNPWSEGIDILLPVLMPLLISYLLYKAACRERLAGVLASLPVVLGVWIPATEMTPDLLEGLVNGAAWLLGAAAALAVLRLQRLETRMAVALGLGLLAGLGYTWLGIYHGGMLPFSEPGPNPRALFTAYAPVAAVCAALVAGPQLGASLARLGRRSRPGGTAAYRTALAGMLVLLAGGLGGIQYSDATLWTWLPGLQPFFLWLMDIGLWPSSPNLLLVYLGLLIYLGGVVWLARSAARAGTSPAPLALVLTLFLPLGAVVPLLQAVDVYSGGSNFGAALAVFAFSLAWAGLSMWVTGRESRLPAPPVRRSQTPG